MSILKDDQLLHWLGVNNSCQLNSNKLIKTKIKEAIYVLVIFTVTCLEFRPYKHVFYLAVMPSAL